MREHEHVFPKQNISEALEPRRLILPVQRPGGGFYTDYVSSGSTGTQMILAEVIATEYLHAILGVEETFIDIVEVENLLRPRVGKVVTAELIAIFVGHQLDCNLDVFQTDGRVLAELVHDPFHGVLDIVQLAVILATVV